MTHAQEARANLQAYLGDYDEAECERLRREEDDRKEFNRKAAERQRRLAILDAKHCGGDAPDIPANRNVGER